MPILRTRQNGYCQDVRLLTVTGICQARTLIEMIADTSRDKSTMWGFLKCKDCGAEYKSAINRTSTYLDICMSVGRY